MSITGLGFRPQTTLRPSTERAQRPQPTKASSVQAPAVEQSKQNPLNKKLAVLVSESPQLRSPSPGSGVLRNEIDQANALAKNILVGGDGTLDKSAPPVKHYEGNSGALLGK